jgi:hypothetical protein
MDFFATLEQETKNRGLQFLVIGGVAVNFYVNHLDPNSEKVRQLFLKYGTLDLHEKIVRACSKG